MNQKKPVRVIKRDERGHSDPAVERRASSEGSAVRHVVSDWVLEHRRRSEEFRQNYAALLKEAGLGLPCRDC